MVLSTILLVIAAVAVRNLLGTNEFDEFPYRVAIAPRNHKRLDLLLERQRTVEREMRGLDFGGIATAPDLDAVDACTVREEYDGKHVVDPPHILAAWSLPTPPGSPELAQQQAAELLDAITTHLRRLGWEMSESDANSQRHVHRPADGWSASGHLTNRSLYVVVDMPDICPTDA